MTTNAADISVTPWYADYPNPKMERLRYISREEVAQMMRASVGKRTDFILVDVRRNDHEGGTIRGSLNLPAQSLYPSIPSLYELFAAAGIGKVIWYCGSCGGRGPRAAGWFNDYLHEKGANEMSSLVLIGGIKGWAKAGPEYEELMDEFDKQVWQAP